MKSKQTLFQRVYDDLHEQIVTGRLAYGTVLPSMRMLCDSYHVGIRTMKDVMARLKAEGYLHTEERKHAVVIYDRSKADQASAIHSVLEYRTCILDVFDTMALIMPAIFSLCASVCSDYALEKWRPVFKNLHRKDDAVKTKLLLSFLYDLLEQSNNLLLRDLYASLELYAKIPLFQDFEGLKDLATTYNDFNGAKWPIEALLARDAPEIERRLGVMYEAVGHGIRLLLGQLSQAFPHVPERASATFTFDIRYGRDAFYVQIVQDLIDQIGAGVYRVGTYLPPEAALARQYRVCVSTVRRALAMLNEIGFAKTYNAKGTMVLWQEDDAIAQCMKNKKLKLETLLYLNDLQLMAVIIKPAADLAFPAISGADKDELRRQMQDPKFLLFEALVQCVIRRQTLPPFKIILEKTSELIVGGYYYSMLYEGPSSDEALTGLTRAAFNSLCSGDAPLFAELLSKCYGHILGYVRDYMVKCGLTEAKKIVTPQ